MFSDNWKFLQKTPSQNCLVGGFHSVNEGRWIMVSKNNHLMQWRFHESLKVLQSLYLRQSIFLYSGIVHLVLSNLLHKKLTEWSSPFSSSWNSTDLAPTSLESTAILLWHSVVWCCHHGGRGEHLLDKVQELLTII